MSDVAIKTKRSFTVIGSDIGFEGGSYKTTVAPAVAAKKAASIMFRVIKSAAQKPKDAKLKKYAGFKNRDTIKFIIRETTRGSARDTFYYVATKIKLDTPIVVKRGGVEYTIDQKITIKTCTDYGVPSPYKR